ncbi:hypothetical protein COOONC_27937 [Cooperia oncophora]
MMAEEAGLRPAELEEMLLSDVTTAEQLSAMRKSLDSLLKKVNSLTARGTQVRNSIETIAKTLKSLREIPAELVQGVSTKSTKQLEEATSSKINEECSPTERELENLKELEVEELRLPAGAECSTNAPPIVYEQLNVGDFDNKEYHLDFDPVATAQRGLQVSVEKVRVPTCSKEGRPSGGRGAGTRASRRRFRAQAQVSLSNAMGSIFAAMALPEVKVYSDPQREGFDQFIMRFTMKYRSLGLRNDLLNQLLLSKLQGYPKRLVREGNSESLVEALRAKLAVDNSAMQMKAYLDLKHLKKHGGVTEFCLELERMSREAYPDASEEELSRTRAGELVSQLTDWPEYLQLFAVRVKAGNLCFGQQNVLQRSDQTDAADERR